MNRNFKAGHNRGEKLERQTTLSYTKIGVVALICLSIFFLGSCTGFTFPDLLDGSLLSTEGPLAISPTSTTLPVGSQFTFSASGGDPPYSYSIVTGSGTIDESSGLYTAPSTPGMDTIQVMDSVGATSEARVIYLE